MEQKKADTDDDDARRQASANNLKQDHAGAAQLP
jgi:hypothetical protein